MWRKNRQPEEATLIRRAVMASCLAVCLASTVCAAGLVKVEGTNLVKKVVAASDNIVATTAKGGGEVAFKMGVLKPYFVLAEEGEYFKITDQQETGGHAGFVKRNLVIEWNTREGLHFQPSALSLGDRPEVQVWKDRATIEQYARTGNKATYGPSYIEEKVTTRALPPNLLPYPVLSSVKVKTVAGTDKRLFRVLIPAYTEAATAEVHLTPQEIKKVLSRVTFCVVFDATGSMEDYAESMAATIEELLNSVSGAGIDKKALSVGFVFFRDLEDEQRLSVVNPAPLEAAVSRLREEARHMTGGGDEAEPVLDAANVAAAEFNWTGSASQEGGKRVAIIVLNDDAKKTTVGLSPKVPKGLEATEIASLLNKKYIRVYALQAGPADRGNLAATLRHLANATGGEYYPYNEDAMKVSRAFSSHIKKLIEGTAVGEEKRAEDLIKASIPGDRTYTVLPLKALDSELISRLRAAAKDFSIKEGGLIIREGWMFEHDDLYQEQVLVEKETIEHLVNFFRLLSDTSANCDDLKRSVTENLKTMLGESIDPDAEIQELIEKKLGIHFRTSLLSFSLEYLCGLVPKERLDLQKRIGEAGGKLSNFLEVATPEFNRQHQTWMKLSLLP